MRRSSAAVFLCAALVLVLGLVGGTAQGAEPHPHIGKLPGFPAMRGVVPVLGSSTAVAAHEKLVTGAFAAVRARSSKLSKGMAEHNEAFFAACENEEFFLATQDTCYRGGPVLHDPTVHLIFWQGLLTPGVKKFPAGYMQTVTRYFEDVALDSGAQTNVFAVDPQYGDTAGPGEYRFAGVDAEVREEAFPNNCVDETQYSEGPCLLDSDIQGEVEKVAGASPKGLKDVYLVFTPPGVGGCLDGESGECAFKQYCAYHGDFGGDGVTPGQQTLYADVPFVGKVEGCASSVQPNGPSGADAAIDDASHELNEVITDPIGSQCKSGAVEVSECESNAWTDVIGQEVADKCLPPESTIAGAYGEPLGELVFGDPTSAFNQLIDGYHYYTQRVWSNEAGVFEGGCVQRAIGASFTVSVGAQAGVPARFDGSGSGAPGDPAVYWVWSFGEGEQLGSASPRISHTFAAPGAQEVGLTAYDAYGNAEGVVELVNVGGAPIPSPPPPTPTPAPPAAKEAASTPAHFSSAQIAAKLGLPKSGRRLVGNGPFVLGRAECPPACVVTLRLYARVASVSRKHSVARLVPVGAARHQGAPRGAVFVRFQPGSLGELALSLNAKGRALQRRGRTLACKLVVTVEGQEGGNWQIVRPLTLVGGGHVARR